MSETTYNPIKSVDGEAVICPSSFQWNMEDVSAEGAGRTEDMVMHKQRIGQVVSVNLSWRGLTTAQVSSVLTAFNPEYIEVEYLDPMEGDYVTKEFYVGNRSAPLYNSKLNLWENVSFNIIARGGE